MLPFVTIDETDRKILWWISKKKKQKAKGREEAKGVSAFEIQLTMERERGERVCICATVLSLMRHVDTQWTLKKSP